VQVFADYIRGGRDADRDEGDWRWMRKPVQLLDARAYGKRAGAAQGRVRGGVWALLIQQGCGYDTWAGRASETISIPTRVQMLAD